MAHNETLMMSALEKRLSVDPLAKKVRFLVLAEGSDLLDSFDF